LHQHLLPIFDGGRRRASLDLAEVRRDLSVAHYEKPCRPHSGRYPTRLASSRWLAQQVSIQQDALGAQTARARLARLRYDNGAAAFLEVLDAQRFAHRRTAARPDPPRADLGAYRPLRRPGRRHAVAG
jgi:outer membrane protein TolC